MSGVATSENTTFGVHESNVLYITLQTIMQIVVDSLFMTAIAYLRIE